ncbi:MAG: rhomboid family intramembrane serine protease [Muribaculaceae bacterium]|nr:rhomboid family intramembrane serine protease [Muribaculaceae bacterium]
MNLLGKWYWLCGRSRWLAWMILTEVGVWLVVTVLSLLGSTFHFDPALSEWLTLPSGFSRFATRPWTLLTYMAVQFDFFHLLFNVLWLYWFGKILLLTLSEKRLAVFFIGGGVAGGLLFLGASALGAGGGMLCGCSAAVIAVMCGAAVMMPDYPLNLFLIGAVRLKWVALACCLLTLLGGGGNQAAHIGGALWGLALAVMLRRGITLPGPRADKERSRDASKMVRILRERRDDMERLDALLDKIKISGYESLSRREKDELNTLSTRIKKP